MSAVSFAPSPSHGLQVGNLEDRSSFAQRTGSLRGAVDASEGEGPQYSGASPASARSPSAAGAVQ